MASTGLVNSKAQLLVVALAEQHAVGMMHKRSASTHAWFFHTRLYLIDGWVDAGITEPLINLLRREVADANAAGQVLIDCTHHALPRFLQAMSPSAKAC